MGIILKEIDNRKYDEGKLINFEYTIKGLDGPNGEPQELRVWFENVEPEDYGITTNRPTYKIFTIIDSQYYEKIYSMPKRDMNLEIVVATGLTALRLSLLEDVGYKEMVAYTIGDITMDM